MLVGADTAHSLHSVVLSNPLKMFIQTGSEAVTTVELFRSQAGQRPRAFQWHSLATAWCMRRQKDQAKMGLRASPTVSNNRLMRWRISHTLRATKGRDGASSPLCGGDALSLTRMATRKARASMASVM